MICMSVMTAFLAGNVSAQTRNVSGTVVDETGEGIIGAAVLVKGTSNGVATDVNGRFQISCPADAVLVFSSIGYDEVEVAVDHRSSIQVTMQISQELLDDVVVIGYGTTRAKNFTGSVDVVRMEDSPIADLGLSTASDLIRGRLSGVILGAETTTVGTNASILVRGQKSINSTSTAPLIVLDGVIFSGSLEDIAPQSIDQISVLKDATSLAAYGSKSANGVIMVTTKKGKEGKPVITFSTSQQLSRPSYIVEQLSPADYIKFRNAKLGHTDFTDISPLSFLEKANYEKNKLTDWWDLVIRTGWNQNYNVSFAGKSKETDYHVNLGRSIMRGSTVGNDFSRNNVSVNLSTKITPFIQVGTNFAFTNTLDDSIPADLGYIVQVLSPYTEPYLPDGKTLRYYVEGGSTSSLNPLWGTQYGGEKEDTFRNLMIGGFLNVDIPWVKGLNFRANASWTSRDSKSKRFQHENIAPVLLSNDWEGEAQSPKYYNFTNANGSIRTTQQTNWVMDFILSYQRQFGDHYVSSSLVYTRDYDLLIKEAMIGKGFSAAGNTLLGWQGLANADNKSIEGPTYVLHTDIGYLARAMYSYQDKYHLNASIRRDGSSVFGANRKWGNFPAVGAAWTISKENFMKGVRWIDLLKLKVSWGANGAQTLEPYGTLSTIALAKDGGIPYYIGGNLNWGQKLTALGNPSLGWQTTTSWNGGFEGDFFDRRLHLDVNGYYSKTTDQIFDRNIPVMTAGITSQKATMGQVDNYGVEINMQTVNIRSKAFSWVSDYVFTLNRNKLIDLYGNGQNDENAGLFLGEPLSVIYGYEHNGIFQEGEYAGSPIFITADGEQTVNPAASDRKILGYQDENFRLSWSNTMQYKDFQFYFMFQGIFSGGRYGLGNNTFAYVSGTSTETATALNIPFWTAAEPNNTYPSPSYRDTKYQVWNPYGHIRLQDVSLSYNMRPVAQFLKLQSARIAFSGHNLFFFAPYWKLSDPMQRYAAETGMPRSFTVSINVTF